MDFKQAREERKWKLRDVADRLPHKYAVSTISDFERTGAGSDRLKQDLEELYGFRKGGEQSGVILNEALDNNLIDDIVLQVQIMKDAIFDLERKISRLRK